MWHTVPGHTYVLCAIDTKLDRYHKQNAPGPVAMKKSDELHYTIIEIDNDHYSTAKLSVFIHEEIQEALQDPTYIRLFSRSCIRCIHQQKERPKQTCIDYTTQKEILTFLEREEVAGIMTLVRTRIKNVAR